METNKQCASNEINKRTKVCKSSMLDHMQSYISQTAEIIKFGKGNFQIQDGFYVIQFNEVDVKMKLSRTEPQLTIIVENIARNQNVQQIYNFVVQEYNGSGATKTMLPNPRHFQLKSNIPQECNFESMKNGVVFHFWKQGDCIEEQRLLEFADCIINTQQKIDDENVENFQFRAHANFLIKSSQVIFNMIKDLKQQYSPDQPVDLSRLFADIDQQYIYMYLCCVYNKNFVFCSLEDILHVLKLAVKLDNQSLISHILNMQSLPKIFKRQHLICDVKNETESENDTNENYPENVCNLQNIFEFAIQHRFLNLIVLCSLEMQKQNQDTLLPEYKGIVDAYKKIGMD